MNTDILEIVKDIVKDFINCFDDTNYYVSPGPLSLNLTLAVGVNDMKDLFFFNFYCSLLQKNPLSV